MVIDERWQNEIKRFDNNLYICFDNDVSLFEIRHKIPFSNIDRRVMYVHNQGEFRRIDYDIFEQLQYFDWDSIYKYRTSDDLADYYMDKMEYIKKKKQKDRNDKRMAEVRDNIKSFEKLQEKMRSTMKPNEVAGLKKEQDEQDYERSKRPNFY